MVLSSVWTLILMRLMRVKQWVVGWLVLCSLVRVLLYYVGLSLDCLCVY